MKATSLPASRPLLERLGGRVDGLRVMEIGCGRGIGVKIIFELLGAREVHGIDLDLQMIRMAKKDCRFIHRQS